MNCKMPMVRQNQFLIQCNHERLSDIDVFRGLLMLLVVLGHSIGWLDQPINRIILSFHMPAFFFVSGMFGYRKTKTNVKSRVNHKFYTLGWQYFIFCIIAIPIALIVDYLGIESSESNAAQLFVGIFIGNPPAMGFWFVYDLLVISIIYIILRTIRIRPIILFLFSFLLSVVISLWFNHKYMLMQHIVCGFSFFVMGDIYYDKIYKRIKEYSIVTEWTIALFFLSIVLVISHYNAPIFMAINDYGNIFAFYLAAFCGIFSVSIISSIINQNRLLEYIGRNSISFLFIHFYSLKASHYLSLSFFKGIDNNMFPIFLVHFIIAISICFIVSELINKYCRWLLKFPISGEFIKP